MPRLDGRGMMLATPKPGGSMQEHRVKRSEIIQAVLIAFDEAYEDRRDSGGFADGFDPTGAPRAQFIGFLHGTPQTLYGQWDSEACVCPGLGSGQSQDSPAVMDLAVAFDTAVLGYLQEKNAVAHFAGPESTIVGYTPPSYEAPHVEATGRLIFTD